MRDLVRIGFGIKFVMYFNDLGALCALCALCATSTENDSTLLRSLSIKNYPTVLVSIAIVSILTILQY